MFHLKHHCFIKTFEKIIPVYGVYSEKRLNVNFQLVTTAFYKALFIKYKIEFQ